MVARADSVAATKRRLTADFDVERATASTWEPTGSSPASTGTKTQTR